MSFSVILVHGTFAKDAEWTRQDSVLFKYLAKQLPTSISSYQWSGGNSYKARSCASIELAERIRKDYEARPEAIRVLIAHSHGGNVAIGALRELGTNKFVDGLVCLGTPFLFVSVRNQGVLASFLKVLLSMILVSPFLAIFLYAVFSMVVYFFLIENIGWEYFFISLFGVALSGLLLFSIPKRLVSTIDNYVYKKAEKTINLLSWPPPPVPPLLNVQVSFDEARMLLRFFAALAEIPRLIWEWIAGHYVRQSGLILFSSFLIVGLLTALNIDTRDAWYLGLPLTVLLVLGVASIVLFPFASLAPLIRSHPAAFGWEGLLSHLMLKLETTHTPDALWPGDAKNLWVPLPEKNGVLRHSGMYDDQETIKTIGEFISELSQTKA